jgi:hypothetical protein
MITRYISNLWQNYSYFSCKLEYAVSEIMLYAKKMKYDRKQAGYTKA